MKKLLAFLGGLFVSLMSSGVALAAAEGAATAGDSQCKSRHCDCRRPSRRYRRLWGGFGPRASWRRRDGKHRAQSQCC